MIIDGQINYEFDSPYLGVPAGITLPNKKLQADYEKAWLAYNDVAIKFEEATQAIEAADAKDTLLLVEAVKAGHPHPGEPSKAEAQRNLDYVTEQLKQSAATANTLKSELGLIVTANADSITEQAVTLERQSLNELVDAHHAAQTLVASAETKAHDLGTRVNWVNALTNINGRTHFSGTIPEVRWPTPHEFDLEYLNKVLDSYLVKDNLVKDNLTPQLTPANNRSDVTSA
jgi:hypothetical protein